MENPSKSKVIVRCGGDEKKPNDHAEPTKVERQLKKNRFYTIASVLNGMFYL